MSIVKMRIGQTFSSVGGITIFTVTYRALSAFSTIFIVFRSVFSPVLPHAHVVCVLYIVGVFSVVAKVILVCHCVELIHEDTSIDCGLCACDCECVGDICSGTNDRIID